ncbi:integrase core domain-containing protein [Trueperella pyogenes]|uniref:integrase core domain-containing protein n=1 Tax=Trueperella pyogenes TaxID=1661 RepID=UPI003D2FFAEA
MSSLSTTECVTNSDKTNSIENLEHAQMLVAQWSRRYNDFHPHSSLSYLSPQKYAEQWRQENTVNA